MLDRWFVDGIIPSYGSVNLLAGNTHAGKSTMLYSMLAAIRYGSTFLGRETRKPKHAAAILADRATQDNPMWERGFELGLIDSYVNAVEDRQYCEMLEITTKNRKNLLGWERFKLLTSRLEVQEDLLLVVDVFTTGFVGDVRSITDTKVNMDLINAYCTRNNVVLVGTGYGVKPTNDKKQRYERYVDRMIGAAPLRGGASTVMYLATPEESESDGWDAQVFEALPRNGKPVRLGVKMDDSRNFNAVPLTKKPPEPREPVLPACYDVLQFLTLEPTNWKELYDEYSKREQEPVSESRFRAYLSELVRRGEAEIKERGSYNACLQS